MAARDRGTRAFAETCPQYLFLSLDDMGNGFEGAKFICSPPLRPADHQAELWTGLVKDDLQVVSTDHCPFDFHGQKDLGRGDFRKVPNGLPGVEDRVDLLHDGGVVAGRISPERWVEIVSTAPARMFGMYPQKGAIAVGSDADIVIYDPTAEHVISASTHHMDVDYSCYEGRRVRGASSIVLSRGRSWSAMASSSASPAGAASCADRRRSTRAELTRTEAEHADARACARVPCAPRRRRRLVLAACSAQSRRRPLALGSPGASAPRTLRPLGRRRVPSRRRVSLRGTFRRTASAGAAEPRSHRPLGQRASLVRGMFSPGGAPLCGPSAR